MITWLFNKQVFTRTMLVLLLAAGVGSFLAIPKESDPDVTIPIVQVTTVLPGASALTVEQTVSTIIEDAVTEGVGNVKEVTTQSRAGVSVVLVEAHNERVVEEMEDEIKDEIERAVGDLPSDATEPTVSRIKFEDQPVLTVAITSQSFATALREEVDQIEQQIKTIDGVADVNVAGVSEKQISVVLDPVKLAQTGLSAAQVAQGLRGRSVSFPVGSIVQNGVEYQIIFDGEVKDPEVLKNVVVGSTANGAPIYIKDIGTVSEELSATEVTVTVGDTAVSGYHHQAVTLGITKQQGVDVIEVTEKLNEFFNELTQTRSDITVHVLEDRGELIAEDISNLSFTALQTILLVVLIVFLGLSGRAALLAGLAIPISFLFSFITLKALGQTINFISLFSLILVVGLLVDAVVVIIEGMTDQKLAGKSALQAIKHTLGEFGTPVIMGTATTVAVFVPLLFLSGVTGQFIRTIPVTVITVLITSLVVALVFIPAIGVFFLPKRVSKTWFGKMRVRATNSIIDSYKDLLEWVLRRKFRVWIGIIGIVLLFASSLSLMVTGKIPAQFLPADEIETFYIDITLPPGTEREQTQKVVEDISRELLLEAKGQIKTIAEVGKQSSFGVGSERNQSVATISIITNDESLITGEDMEQLFAYMRTYAQQATQAQVSVFTASNGPSEGPPVVINLRGKDTNSLLSAAQKVKQVLAQSSQTVDVQSSVDRVQTQYVLTPKRDAIERVGVTPAQVNASLQALVFGTEVDDIPYSGSKSGFMPIMVNGNISNTNNITSDDRIKSDVQKILSLSMQTPKGPVPFDTLVNVELEGTLPGLTRVNKKSQVQVTSYLAEGALASVVVENITPELNTLKEELAEEGIQVVLGGEQADTQDSQSETGIALIVGVALMALVLIAQFNSLKHMAIIISVIPLGLIGVLWGLFLGGEAFSFPASLGFVALAGIVVNNAIILIEVLNTEVANSPLKPLHLVVVKGAAKRIRPILLTTATTILGMVPLLTTSPIWKPLALTVMAGLAGAVFLTLFFIPIVYWLVTPKKTIKPRDELFYFDNRGAR